MNPGLLGPSAQTPIWAEPVRGFYTDPGQFAALSGLDLLRSMLDSGLGPPAGYLFGFRLAAVEPGGVTFTMPVTDWLLFSQGVVSGATLGILVDAPLGCTVQTALPPATPFTTAEISLRFLRTVVPQSGTLTAKGQLIHAGQTTDLPAPPIVRFCGIAPVQAEAGSTTWRMPASEWLCAPVRGRLYGGAIAMLAGTAIDGAVQTTLPAGTAFGPVDLKVYFLRPVAPDGRDLMARGTVIHRGRSMAIGTSEVFDADGKKVAVATGSSVILPGRPATVTAELALPGPGS